MTTPLTISKYDRWLHENTLNLRIDITNQPIEMNKNPKNSLTAKNKKSPKPVPLRPILLILTYFLMPQPTISKYDHWLHKNPSILELAQLIEQLK